MLSLVGIIGIVIFAIQVYRSAVDYQRNAALWTILTVAIGIMFQFVIPFVIGVIYVIVIIAGGTPPEEVAVEQFGLLMVLGVICLILSFVGMFLVMRHVSKVPDDPLSAAGPEPPPPPTF